MKNTVIFVIVFQVQCSFGAWRCEQQRGDGERSGRSVPEGDQVTRDVVDRRHRLKPSRTVDVPPTHIYIKISRYSRGLIFFSFVGRRSSKKTF